MDATAPQSHFPVVAEGTGKTAGNEGATSKEVYNVRSGSRVVRKQDVTDCSRLGRVVRCDPGIQYPEME